MRENPFFFTALSSRVRVYRDGDDFLIDGHKQVNNTHTDWIRTGSLYGIVNIKEVYVKDNEWFTMYITVQGKRVIVKLNDKVVLDYTEPDNVQRKKGDEQRVLSSGTFALQGHDPNSLTYFKNIMVKPLP